MLLYKLVFVVLDGEQNTITQLSLSLSMTSDSKGTVDIRLPPSDDRDGVPRMQTRMHTRLSYQTPFANASICKLIVVRVGIRQCSRETTERLVSM